MFMMTLNTKKFEAFIDDHAKNQIPYASAMAINKLLFDGKKGTERDMDRNYDGGATRYTKQGVRYLRATKEIRVGYLYIQEDRPYVMKTIDGGTVTPTKSVLIKPMNISTNKYGNITKGAVGRKYDNPKFFAGKPYRGSAPNSARKSLTFSANDPDVGLWERMGRKGKRGGIARQTVRMVVKFGDSRIQRKFFDARRMAKVRIQKNMRKVFGRELAKAKSQALARGR